MSVEEEKVDDVSHDGWRFQPLFLRTVHHKISSESARLFDMRQCWITKRGDSVDAGSGKRGGAMVL